MTETEATAAFGTLLQVGDGATPEVFTTLAEVKDISGPTLSRDTEEVTHHLSPDQFKEKVATLKEAGEVTFDMNYLPGNPTQSMSAGLGQDYKDGTVRNIKIVFADVGSTEWILPSIVTGWEPDSPVGGSFDCSVTLEVARAPTLN